MPGSARQEKDESEGKINMKMTFLTEGQNDISFICFICKLV